MLRCAKCLAAKMMLDWKFGGRYRGKLSGPTAGVGMLACMLSERVLQGSWRPISTKSALPEFQLELLSSGPFPLDSLAFKVACFE